MMHSSTDPAPTVRIVQDRIDQLRLDHLAALLDRDPPAPGDPLPALWHWLFCIDPIRRSKLGPDGHELVGGFIPSLPASHRMWAGGDVRFLQPLHVGDEITRESHIAKVDCKQGSAGDLWFVTIRHDFKRGEASVLVEDQNLVYMANVPRGRPSINPPSGTIMLTERFDDVSLQRYSALTLNSHRIHFDRHYCRDTMRDERLVVHAPLLATCLADQIELDHRLSRLRYKMISATREDETVCFAINHASRAAFVTSSQGELRLLAQFEVAD